MDKKATPGSEKNPLILETPVNKSSLLARYYGELNASVISDIHDRMSVTCYVNNVLSNRALSSYEMFLCLWLRLNLNRFEDIIAIEEERSKQKFPIIGERTLRREDSESIINEDNEISEYYQELVNKCEVLIEEGQIPLYRFLTNSVSKKDLSYLFNVFYENPEEAFSLDFLSKEHIAEILVEHFAEERNAPTQSNFIEIAENYWSRVKLYDFGISVLTMDEEDRDYFSRCSHDEMVSFINDFYYDAALMGDDGNNEYWSVHFETHHENLKKKHVLNYPLFRDGPPKFLNARSIHNLISAENFNANDFLGALYKLENFGYIRVSPLDKLTDNSSNKDLFHQFERKHGDKTQLNDKNSSAIRFYYHIRIFNLMSMKDYSQSWSDIVKGKNIDEVKRNKKEIRVAMMDKKLTKLSKQNS